MKKFIIILIILSFAIFSCFCGCTSYGNYSSKFYEYKYEDVKDILVRFHVIANSDSDIDQNVKLKVKDRVIEYIYPLLKDSDNIDTSRKILSENREQILFITKNVLDENGFDYEAQIDFSNENFPEKSYGSIILPAGEYEAFRIVLGDGKGQNWWCVMFPPMCFIDVTKGRIEDNESKKELDEEIQKEEINKNDNQDLNQNIEIKFKFLEIFEKN